MANKECVIQNFCPFWKPESKKCLACNGGLFIPLDEHIEVYCKKPDYPQCLQYSMQVRTLPEAVDHVSDPNDNRRQYQRHPSVHKVTLVKLIKSDEIVSHYSTVASTLDLSQGGMRLNVGKPLADDTIIQFSFEDSLPEILREGTGQVQWCNKKTDETGYQAGISFQGDQLIKTMGLYLDLQQKV
ncbi:MAG: PilZ domain-containing protein [Bacteroidetes bacterium]|nr:PilZ domain-containing protein [Bacteroidota bacterium]